MKKVKCGLYLVTNGCIFLEYKRIQRDEQKRICMLVWNGWCCVEMVTLAGQVFRFLLGVHPLHLKAEVARLPLPLCNWNSKLVNVVVTRQNSEIEEDHCIYVVVCGHSLSRLVGLTLRFRPDDLQDQGHVRFQGHSHMRYAPKREVARLPFAVV